MGPQLNLKLSGKKEEGGQEKPILSLLCARERIKERREESFQDSLRSMELYWSVFIEPRTKVHRNDEGYVWVLEKTDFAEVPRGEILENRSCRV